MCRIMNISVRLQAYPGLCQPFLEHTPALSRPLLGRRELLQLNATLRIVSRRRIPFVARSLGTPSQLQGIGLLGQQTAAILPCSLHNNLRRRRVHVQLSSQSDAASVKDQPGDVPEIASPSASDRIEVTSQESSKGVPSQDRRAQSQISDTDAAEQSSSSTPEQSTGLAYALHRQPVLSPVVDEYCQIMGNAVSWTGELLMQFLRIPLLPRENRLMELRLAVRTDPSNADK